MSSRWPRLAATMAAKLAVPTSSSSYQPRCAARARRFADAVLVADRLPPFIQGPVLYFRTPVGRAESSRLIHGRKRTVTVHLHPVHVVAELRHPPLVNLCQLIDRGGQPVGCSTNGSPRHQAYHRPQGGRALQRGQPLDPAAVAGPPGRDIAGAPFLRRGPRDDLGPVRAIAAVGLEHAIRVTPAPHVGEHRHITGPGEPGRALRLGST